ncbi:MAG TPA: SgcJ/EcaC family oxidoreductase [Chryseolinea sp.]|nr:SgcJ/EcaC family oxidoreductase [Chryseolinea sp.]
MQKLRVVTTILLITGLACCNRPTQHDDAGDIANIKALSAIRAKAFNEGNADVIAAAFTESGVLMAPDKSSTSGRAAVREYYQQIFDQYETFLESGYEEVKVSGDVAYGVGFAKVKLVPHGGGDTLVSTAKYVNIPQRQSDGSWLTTHDIWNANEH